MNDATTATKKRLRPARRHLCFTSPPVSLLPLPTTRVIRTRPLESKP
jgi:hypothetical protein